MVRTLLLILFTVAISHVAAQKQQLVFHHITSDQGLSQNHGMAILQDHKGFMWFGTKDGLNKYDANQIIIYKHDPLDSTTLSNSDITSLFEDANKNLWVGTRKGVNVYDREKDNFKRIPLESTFSDNIIYTIGRDAQNDIWIGADSGLYFFDMVKKSFNQYLKGIGVTCLSDDGRGNLWIGTREHGLYFFDRKKQTFKNYPLKKEMLQNYPQTGLMSSIIEDISGNLLISTWGSGLILFDRKKDAFTTTYTHNVNDPESISKDIIYVTYKDSKGRIWMGTENGGLNLFNPQKGTFQRYLHDPCDKRSLSNNSVSAIYEDVSGTIWVGVHRGGINYYNPKTEKFTLYQQTVCRPGISHNNTKAFCEARDGKIWIATDGGGITVFDPRRDTFSYFRHNPKDRGTIGSDVILSLYEDKEGTMWAGTYLEGLAKYDGRTKKFTHYKHDPLNKNSLSNNNVWNIAEDSHGNFWVGTREGGLNLMDRKSGTFTRYEFDKSVAKSISNNVVNSIYEDSKKNLWIGTENGLNLFDPENNGFIRFYAGAGQGNLSSDNILTIFEDRSGRLWVGTENGLNLFDQKKGTSRVISKKSGLPNNVIQAVLEDDHNNLWVSTLGGLSQVEHASNKIRNYTMSDGLQGHEFIQNAAIKTRDGQMIFGGINGFNLFHPDSVTVNTFMPPVYITGFQLFNEPVGTGNDSPLQKHITETKEITLSYKQSIIAFEFAALNYIQPEKNQYAYRMDAFDKDWNYPGTRNRAGYTNLNPGKYVLRVKASNNDNLWNEAGTSLTLIITPPFWNTPWFKTLAGLLILASVYSVYLIKTYQIKEENKRLEARVHERTRMIEEQKQEILKNHHELELLNQEISQQNEILERKVEERTRDLRASNNELAASEEELRQTLEHALQINEELTESKELLNQQNQELHKINTELDHFVYSTSHDLRAPLSSLLGLINIAKMAPIEEVKATYFDMMEKSIMKLDTFAKNIISYYKNARLEVRVQPLDFEELFNETTDFLKYMDRSNTIRKEISVIGHDIFYSDHFRLRIVFNNIISNSIQYSNPRASDSFIRVRIVIDERQALIEFEDNGCGIDAENIEKVFNMFYRASESSKGSGLGLYIVKETVRTLGGTIRVNSTFGEGTLFSIQLPNLKDMYNNITESSENRRGESKL